MIHDVLRQGVSAALLGVTLLASGAPRAHDLWLDQEIGRITLRYGHERSGHAGDAALEYRPDQIQAARCFNIQGKDMNTPHSATWPVALQGDCAASLFALSSGYWSKTPYGTRNVTKSEAGGAVLDSWLSLESAKRVQRWGEALRNPLGDGLELSPQTNPLALKPGDKLTLRATLRDKPMSGVTVAYFGQPRGLTDERGLVNIRLKEKGFQLIQASLSQPLADGRADRTLHATNLQFDLP